jgi:hypothetical protein
MREDILKHLDNNIESRRRVAKISLLTDNLKHVIITK